MKFNLVVVFAFDHSAFGIRRLGPVVTSSLMKKMPVPGRCCMLLLDEPLDWPGCPAGGVLDHAVDEAAHLQELAAEAFDHHRHFFSLLCEEEDLMLESFRCQRIRGCLH